MASSLVSVIVPVYNVEPFLEECLNSIVRQTYQNIEVIVVDDGSTDGSGMLCDVFGKSDKRVRVVHQSNGGLSAARNAGLGLAQGEYIAFVDSDDAVAPGFLAALLSARADVAQCAACRDKHYLQRKDGTDVSFQRLTPYQASERLQFDSTGDATVVWNKLYRRHLFDGVEFPVGKQHEDEFVTYRLLWKADEVCVTARPLYFYRQHPESTMGAGFSPRSLHAIEALEERAAFYREHGQERLAAMTDVVACYRLCGMWNAVTKTLPEQAPQVRERVRALCRNVLGSPFVPVKKKLSVGLRAARAGLLGRAKLLNGEL